MNSYASYAALGGNSSGGTFRVVTWGAKVNFVGSDFANQGVKTLFRAQSANLVDLQNLVGTGPGLATFSPQFSRTRMPMPVTYIGVPESKMQHEIFNPISSNIGGGGEESLPWGGALVIWITGGPASTQLIDVDVIINYEVQLLLGAANSANFAAKAQSPTPGPSDHVANVAARIRATFGQFIEQLPIEGVTQLVGRRVAQWMGSKMGGMSSRLIEL